MTERTSSNVNPVKGDGQQFHVVLAASHTCGNKLLRFGRLDGWL